MTPEEAALVLQALGFGRETQIYIAAGEIYGGERRLAQLRAAFPKLVSFPTFYRITVETCYRDLTFSATSDFPHLQIQVKKETLLDRDDLQYFQNHSSQMAALDFMVSVASNTFIPTYDGNMARLVEGHRRHVPTIHCISKYMHLHVTNSIVCRYSNFRKTILLGRKKLVELVDMHQNGTLKWNEFADGVKQVHEKRTVRPTRRTVILDRPKEEDYFYANPHECLCEETNCDDFLGHHNTSSQVA